MAGFHLVTFLILRDERDRLLLLRRSDVSYANGLWCLPGGHVESSESLAGAVVRETWEEVGVRVAPGDLVPTGMIRYADQQMVGLDVYFTATRSTGIPRPVSECDAVGWYDADALPEPVVPWLPAALDRLLEQRAWFTDLVTSTGSVPPTDTP